MGGMRADAETQSLASPASAAGPGERESPPRGQSRWAVLAAYLLSGVVLFVAYLRLSETYSLNSDSANILLMGWDLLHGHLLLHGWYMSDVSFYPTELPQYALLVGILGLHMQTAHVAAAMTYTLTFLLAVVLARSGSTGRAAVIRTLIAAGIMLAPQIGLGVFALDLSVGHIGTAVPLLLTWLLLSLLVLVLYAHVVLAGLLAPLDFTAEAVAGLLVREIPSLVKGLVCLLGVFTGELLGVVSEFTEVRHGCPLFRRWLDYPSFARRLRFPRH